MNLDTIKEKRINIKSILVMVLLVAAFYGIWRAGIGAGDWLIRYLDIKPTQAQQVKK